MKDNNVNIYDLTTGNYETTLWFLYNSNALSKENKIEVRNNLVERYYYLVLIFTDKYFLKYRKIIKREEVLSNASLGLLKAIENYDYKKNSSFENFAQIRIKGEIIDGLREIDLCPRRLREKLKLIKKVKKELSLVLNRKPTKKELLKKLSFSEKVYDNTIKRHREIYSSISINDVKSIQRIEKLGIEAAKLLNPETIYINKETKSIIHKAIETLPDKEKSVIKLYYFDKIKIKDISNKLKTNPQRVRQILKKAYHKLKIIIKN